MKGIRKLFFGLLLMTIVGISCQVQAKAGVDTVTYSTTSGLSGSFTLPDSDEEATLSNGDEAIVYVSYDDGTSSSKLCDLTYNDGAKNWTASNISTDFDMPTTAGKSFSFSTVSGSIASQKSAVRAAIAEGAAGNLGDTSVKVFIDCADAPAVDDSQYTTVKGVKPTGAFSDVSNVSAAILEGKITFNLIVTEAELSSDDYLFQGERYKLEAKSDDGWLSGSTKAKFKWYNGTENAAESPEYTVNEEINGTYAPLTYIYDKVTNIGLNTSLSTIEINDTVNRTVTVTSDSSGWGSSDVTWTSDPATGIMITKVTGGIDVKGTVAGTYVVKASIADGVYPGEAYLTNVATVEVTDSTPPEPTQIELELGTTTISKDGTTVATVSAKTPSGAKVDAEKLSFIIGDETIVSAGTASPSGLRATATITGNKDGKTTITAKYDDGPIYSNPVTITVEESSGDLTAVTFENTIYNVPIGQYVDVKVIPTPSTYDLAPLFTDGTMYYSASSGYSTYVSLSGTKTPTIRVTGKAAGSITLSAKHKTKGSIVSTCTINVVQATDGIEIKLSPSSTTVGNTVTATVSSTNGDTLDPNKLKIEPDDASVATVGSLSQSGANITAVISAKKAGSTKIKATYAGSSTMTDEATLTVTGGSEELESISFEKTAYYLDVDETVKVKLEPEPSDYDLASLISAGKIKFTTSGNSAGYAKLEKDTSDNTVWKVTGLKNGYFTLNAKHTSEGAISASCTIYVGYNLDWDCPTKMTKGDTEKITVEATDEDEELDPDNLTFTSSNTSVITVKQIEDTTSATLKAVSTGTSKIKAEYKYSDGSKEYIETTVTVSGGSGDDDDFEIEYYPDSRTLNVKMPKSLTKPDGTVVDNITGFYVRFRYNGTDIANTGTKYSEIFKNTSSTSTATVDAKYFEDLTNNKSNQSMFTGDSPKIEYAVYPVANSTIISSIELADSVSLYKITLGSSNSTYFTYKVSLEGSDVEKSAFYGLKNQTFKVTASPKDGYSFSRWSDSNYTSNPIDSYKVTTSTTLYAVATTSTSSSVSSSSMNTANSTTAKAGGAGGSGGYGSGDYDDVPRTGESKTDIWVLWSVLLLSILAAGFMIYRRFGLVKAISRIEDEEKAEALAAAEREREENLKKVTDLRNLK